MATEDRGQERQRNHEEGSECDERLSELRREWSKKVMLSLSTTTRAMEDEDEDGSKMLLPDPEGDAGKKNKKQDLFDDEAAKKLETSPALSGAIPIAIFDISKKQPFFGAAAGSSSLSSLAASPMSRRERRLSSTFSAAWRSCFQPSCDLQLPG